MDIATARKIVTELKRNHRNLSLEAIDIALEQLEIALRADPEPGDTLEINVTDSVNISGNVA